MPQPTVRGAPGQAPLGVVVVEGLLAPQRIAFLARLVALAGPVIARFEALRVSDDQAERLRQQRDRLRTKQYEDARLVEELMLQWQTQEVERANTLKSEFLASMSHELRTPINAVLGHTANMIEGIYGAVSEDQLEMLKRIRSAANHLLALINDILDLARIEAWKMPLRIE